MQGGTTLQFSAWCYYSNGVTDNCSLPDVYGYSVTAWNTSNPTVMTVGQVGFGSPGLAFATGPGVAYVQAQIGSIASSTWVITVGAGDPVITIKGRVTFKGQVTPN
jgi:hypothetical protein